MTKFANEFIDNEQTEFQDTQPRLTFLLYPRTPTRVNVSTSRYKRKVYQIDTHIRTYKEPIRQNQRTRKKQDTKTNCKVNRASIKESPEDVKLQELASILGD